VGRDSADATIGWTYSASTIHVAIPGIDQRWLFLDEKATGFAASEYGNQVVAASGVDRHQRAADATMAEAL